MRKRKKGEWVKSVENLVPEDGWIAGQYRKYTPEQFERLSSVKIYPFATLFYRPDHPHWVVRFNHCRPAITKYYSTKAAAKAAAMLSL